MSALSSEQPFTVSCGMLRLIAAPTLVGDYNSDETIGAVNYTV